MVHSILAAVALVQSTVPVPAEPAGASPSVAPFDAQTAMSEIRRIIGEGYVLPELRPTIDRVLAEGLASGRYDVSDPGLFAERVTADLERASQDQHLYLRHDPARVAAVTAANRGAGGGPADRSLIEADARRRNHGLRELRVLPGNVRYLEISSFDWIGDDSREAIDSAMKFLAGGDAVIIDLRRNGGGSGQAVHQVIGHFLPAETPLITFYEGEKAVGPTMRSPAGLSTMIGKPLYLLTSRGTGSAAEELAAQVVGNRIGETVGEATSGAAYMNALFPIDGRFELSVSVARPVVAATGTDWEGSGIPASINAPVESALAIAHAHAVRKIASHSPDPHRRRLEGLAAGLDAIRAARAAAAPPSTYVGTYGDRRVELADGQLWLRQDERPRRQLVPVDGHVFTLADDPQARIEFHVSDGRAGAFDQGPAGGPVLGRFERQP